MCFYLRGKNVPEGTELRDAAGHASIAAAIDEAKAIMRLGDVVVWIIDAKSNLILSATEIRQWVGDAPPEAV